MKKYALPRIASLLLAMLLTLAVFAGCDTNLEKDGGESESSSSTTGSQYDGNGSQGENPQEPVGSENTPPASPEEPEGSQGQDATATDNPQGEGSTKPPISSEEGDQTASDNDENGPVDEPVSVTSRSVIKNSLLGFLRNTAQRPEISPLLNMLQNGSLELKLEMDGEKMSQSLGGAENDVGSIGVGGKIYFGDSAVLFKDVYADVTSPSGEVDFDIQGDLFLGSDYMYLSNQSILGGTVGMIRGEMAEAFRNSVFVKEGVFAQEDVEVITQLLELYDSAESEGLSEELAETLVRYVELFMDSLMTNAMFSQENKTVAVGGEEVESRVVTMTVDEKAVVRILTDLYNAVEDDPELRSLIKECGDLLSEYTGMTGSALVKSFEEMLDELGGYLETLDEDIPKGYMSLEITTPTDKTTLRKLVLSGQEEGGELLTFLTLDLGKDGIKTSNRISLEIMDGFALTYKVEQVNASVYRSSLDITYTVYPETAPGKEPAAPVKETSTIVVQVNRQDNTFAISIPEIEVTFGGIRKIKDDKTTVVFNSITSGNETLKGFTLTVAVDGNDPMPAVVDKENVKNILDLTKGNWVDIADRVEQVFGDLFGEAAPDVPAGYDLYDDGYIAFAYPEDWSQQGGEDYLMWVDPATGTNVAVAYEDRTDVYATMTTKTFQTTIKPMFEQAGLKISDEGVDHYQNEYGAKITEIYYVAESDGVFMEQILLAVNSGERTYIITITMAEADYSYTLFNNVIRTLCCWYD